MIERAIKEVTFPSLKVLILDEAQDCTPTMVCYYKMAPKVKRIYLRDDDQAIYKWNGADPKYFKIFPGRKVKLKKNKKIWRGHT